MLINFDIMSVHEKIIYEIWKEGKFSKELILDDSTKD